MQTSAPLTANPVYLDCSATTPLELEVAEELRFFLEQEYGNAGSRTHELGARAKRRVQLARRQLAKTLDADAEEVLFTSGATEANNIAILGLRGWCEAEGRRHVVTTAIEHKAVLEPVEALRASGFEITYVPVSEDGRVSVSAVTQALRPDTGLVSVMQVNNETGVRQPVAELARALADHPAYLHVDAAQGFGKLADDELSDRRIDLLSVSAHKLYGPKGVGALIARRRGYRRPPLQPLMFGGGQERGLRPGTLPVALIAALGTAAEIAVRDGAARASRNVAFRERTLEALAPLDPVINGDPEHSVPHVLNMSIPGIDAEALMVALKSLVAISNGSACTSHSYSESHVLSAMGLPPERIAGAVRLSWSHLTPEPDWPAIVDVTTRLRAASGRIGAEGALAAR